MDEVRKMVLNPFLKIKHITTSIFEKSAACSLVCVPVIKLACKVYFPFVKNEIEKANVNCNDRVLFIGGGSLPYSAILINKLTSASVEVIDRDYEAYWHSLQLEKRYFRGLYKPYFKCGTEINPCDYDVVIVARQVEDKDRVIEHLTKNAGNLRIIVR